MTWSCLLFLCLGGPLGLRAGGRGARRRRNKGLRGEAHHARAASGPSGLRNVVLGDEGTRACGERRTTPGPPADPIVRGTWCSSTKEQGLAGRGAPRPARLRPIRLGGRGARRRRNKGLRGEAHHVRPAFGPSGSGTWCSSTKEQGLAGRGAPRPARTHRSPNRAGKNKPVRQTKRNTTLIQLANIFKPEKPNNKFKIPLFSTHSCRMKTNVY